MIKESEIERVLSKELEGNVFEYVSITNSGDTFFCAKDYYTVKDGEVYFIAKDGVLQPSGDTMLSLKSECRKVGKYDPKKQYRATRITMTQAEIKKALKL